MPVAKRHYEPPKVEARCIEDGCDKVWRSRNSNWPWSSASRHTNRTGHECVVQHISFCHLTRKEDEDD